MTIECSWTIAQLLVYPEESGEFDVVTTIAWECTATDGTYSSSTSGGVPLKLDPAEPFTPYDQLTEAQVLGWLFATIGQDVKLGIEKGLAMQVEQLARQIQPKPLPW